MEVIFQVVRLCLSSLLVSSKHNTFIFTSILAYHPLQAGLLSLAELLSLLSRNLFFSLYAILGLSTLVEGELMYERIVSCILILVHVRAWWVRERGRI